MGQNSGWFVVLGAIIGSAISLIGSTVTTIITQRATEKRERLAREHANKINNNELSTNNLYNFQDSIGELYSVTIELRRIKSRSPLYYIDESYNNINAKYREKSFDVSKHASRLKNKSLILKAHRFRSVCTQFIDTSKTEEEQNFIFDEFADLITSIQIDIGSLLPT